MPILRKYKAPILLRADPMRGFVPGCMEPHFKRSVAEKSDEIDRTSDNHVVLRTS
jgi:hypothetical protein